MAFRHKPRRGSLGFVPKKRAKRIYPRVRTHPQVKETKIAEFATYKTGMTQAKMIDDKKGSPTFNQEIVVPATILEAPPLKVAAVRAYAKNADGGLKVAAEAWAPVDKLDKNITRKVEVGKKKGTIEKLEKTADKLADVRLLVYTQPNKAGIRKKTPELFEVVVGGTNVQEKLGAAKARLGNEIAIAEVFKEGQLVDVLGVTKGFGYQGSIFRFGAKRLGHKAQKVRRKVGAIGPWNPHRTSWRVPQMGQLGFHARTEYNKRILRISNDAKEVANPAGWKNYGIVKSAFVLVKGSVPGHTNRLVILRQALRPYQAERPPQVTAIRTRQF